MSSLMKWLYGHDFIFVNGGVRRLVVITMSNGYLKFLINANQKLMMIREF